uniref:NBS-LRR protein n=1 Tax=Cicer arietinum TaxID=3827 RepID=W0LWR4_CICAR|nr:NBS-LRR protein [Cicer arietinum]
MMGCGCGLLLQFCKCDCLSSWLQKVCNEECMFALFNMMINVPKEIAFLKEEMEKLNLHISEAREKVAAAEEGDRRKHMKEKATDLTRLYFRIEDVIDEWNSYYQHEKRCEMGCVTLPSECERIKCVNTRCYVRLQIAVEIRGIKLNLVEINDKTKINSSSEQGTNGSTENPDEAWKILRRSPYMSQTKILGFEAQNGKLIGWLEDGNENRSVLVVVGMAGQGKTTLVKEIFDNEEVIGKFKCNVWICVSDFDSPEKFFRFMLKKFLQPTEEEEEKDNLPHGFYTMNLNSLRDKVKKHLHKQRYVLFFDDVWDTNFWHEIKHTLSDEKNGSRIIITTRNEEVFKTCKRSSLVDVQVHNMQPLTDKLSEELLCHIAFKPDVVIPKKVEGLCSQILKACGGLPLGIVAIGVHVDDKSLPSFRWKNEIESSFIRSVHFFTDEELSIDFVSKIPSKYKKLKVLDFEDSKVSYDLKDLGNLIHLKYLSFRNTKVKNLPKSIGKLVNLETLDLRGSDVNEIPEEVSMLRKLRHLLGDKMSLIQLKDKIGSMLSLLTLCDVKVDERVGLIEKGLEKLRKIKDLGLTEVMEGHGSYLCCAINKMKRLEKLSIVAKSENDVIDLENMKVPSLLQKLRLQGKLNQLPEWVQGLHHLVKLVLSGSELMVGYDLLNLLKDLPNLLFLSITSEAYKGESLDFQDRSFKALEELQLGSLNNLNSITVDINALPSLKKLCFRDIPQLKSIRFSPQHLENLQHFYCENIPYNFRIIISISPTLFHRMCQNPTPTY